MGTEIGELGITPRPSLPNPSRVIAHIGLDIHVGHWGKWTSPWDSGLPSPAPGFPRGRRDVCTPFGCHRCTHLDSSRRGVSEYVDRTKGSWGNREQAEPRPHFTFQSQVLLGSYNLSHISAPSDWQAAVTESGSRDQPPPLWLSCLNTQWPVWMGGRPACQLAEAVRGGASFLS